MPRVNQNDLLWTTDGDFIIGEAGDLKDTDEESRQTNDPLVATRQVIGHRILCEANGWPLHARICAGLERFIGNTIEESLLRELEATVKSTLTYDGQFHSGEITVKALELTAEAIALMIWVRGADAQDRPVFTIAWDTQRGYSTRIR
jgi:hypothetical protein